MKSMRGVLLVEVLLAVAFMAALVAIGTQVAIVSLSSTTSSEEKDISHRLAREMLEGARAVSASDWYQLAYADRAPAPYHATTTASSSWAIAQNSETLIVGSHEYTRSITIASTSRDFTTKNLEEEYNAAHDDPSTLLVTAKVSSVRGEITLSEYITRWHNITCVQNRWTTLDASTITTSTQDCTPTIFKTTAIDPTSQGFVQTGVGIIKLSPNAP